MHYDCVNGSHGLPHDPFKAIVAPRPIGWIGSKGKSGVQNLAPYSYFNAVADKPHFVMFSSVGIKDSVKNIEETGVFTFSLATEKLFDAMNGSSVPANYEIDEFKLTNLPYVQGKFVDAPYVKDSPAALECEYWKTVDMPGADRANGKGTYVIFGKVLGVYIDDEFIFTEVYLIGIILTFIIALTTIKLFMNYIKRISLKIFVIYRVFLGLVILLFVYFN